MYVYGTLSLVIAVLLSKKHQLCTLIVRFQLGVDTLCVSYVLKMYVLPLLALILATLDTTPLLKTKIVKIVNNRMTVQSLH